jgi:riboflavin kinase/FMN adenylyltransferase
MSLRVFRSLEGLPPEFGPCALTVGNFDGVHAAHRRIMERVVSLARENGWKPAVLTFDPHPAALVAPERAPRLMTTIAQRCELMAATGVEQVFVLPFTRQIAALTPLEFVRDILAARLQARAVLVGENFRFGARAAGDTNALAALGAQFGFQAVIVPSVRRKGLIVSSSGIRGMILSGNVYLAGRMLERPHFVEDEVVSGRGIGSKRTVPTLNLGVEGAFPPADGVYVTRTSDPSTSRHWRSITNVGVRPTFGGGARTIESFLLDPPPSEPPARIRVEFLHRVREERRFESPEALKARILLDVARAQAWFHRTARLAPGPA